MRRCRSIPAHDPADVRVPEPAQLRRMDVLRGVRILVVPAVVAGPPQDALLGGGLRAEREQELERARRLVRPVREVAVIGGRHHEHADEVRAEGQRGARPGPAARDDADHRGDMYAPERQGCDAEIARPGPADGSRRRLCAGRDRRCCCGPCVHICTLTVVRSRPVRTWSQSRRARTTDTYAAPSRTANRYFLQVARMASACCFASGLTGSALKLALADLAAPQSPFATSAFISS